jgi:sterol desaturase/sphingolipid hydroxylase (fatty acid hydroxylase superfamily)
MLAERIWQGQPMRHDTIVALAVLGVVGQVLGGLLIVVGLAALAGARGPLRRLRTAPWGYELWAAFVVAAIATGGSPSARIPQRAAFSGLTRPPGPG